MSGPKIRDVPLHVLRKMAAQPMTPWEGQSARGVSGSRVRLAAGEVWLDDCAVNNRYAVQFSLLEIEIGVMTHLWIRAHDQQMPRSWSDLQRIKADLCGADRVAVEVFPPASELVDEANMAHLWVFPKGYVLPFRLR